MDHDLKTALRLFHRFQTYFFDLDGCIYFNKTIAPGAEAILQRLKEANKQVFFVTNNSRESATEIAIKLQAMGLEVIASDILAVTDYIGRYLREHYGILSIHAAGSSSLNDALKNAGHHVLSSDDGEDNGLVADTVVVGLDRAFTYNQLAHISELVGRGARLIAANADLSHPGHEGVKIPETGALVAAIEAVTGARAEFVGKPEKYLFLYGMEACSASAENSVMIGDNYNTDIIGGKHAGMYTVWLSGLKQSERGGLASKNPAADVIVEHLPEFNSLLGG